MGIPLCRDIEVKHLGRTPTSRRIVADTIFDLTLKVGNTGYGRSDGGGLARGIALMRGLSDFGLRNTGMAWRRGMMAAGMAWVAVMG